MKTSRRNLLKFLGFGAGAAAAAPFISFIPEIVTPQIIAPGPV